VATVIVMWAAVCASAEKAAGPSSIPDRAEGTPGQVVDFRYAPPQWQTAICLPDDPHKSLVDNNGALLYHYGQGGREFATRIAVEVTGDAVWKKQELFSPRVPIVITYRIAPGLEITEEAFAVTSTQADDQALLAGALNGRAPGRSGLAKPVGPARNDLVLVHVKNTGPGSRTFQPRLIVDTTLGASREADRVVVNHHETVTCSLKMAAGASGKQFPLDAMTVAADKTATFFVLYSGGGTIVTSPASLQQAEAARDHAIAYWQQVPLPYGRVQVPDAGIQALIDSSIRNI